MTELNYTINVENRNYYVWSVFDSTNLNQLHLLQMDPFKSKLFSDDQFTIDNTGKVDITYSSVRSIDNIAAVLILNGNKTYGRIKNKFLYKCVPDDVKIPSFLVPYAIKNMGFSKVLENLYITFSFDHWKEKNPHGRINNVIGNVDVLEHFYDYQLHCKNLSISIQQFQKNTTKAIQQHSNSHDAIIQDITQKDKNIEDRTDTTKWYIFSIDPKNSVDFDDAFSINTIDVNKYVISVYISNVTLMLDALQLWNYFSKRVSTIYLPDRKRPMLPTVLSDCLCSLQENQKRMAFVMDITITSGIVESISYTNACIQVQKNFRYEETSLLNNFHYKLLFIVVKELTITIPPIKTLNNSHDLVEYIMVFMNSNSAKLLKNNNTGLFRSSVAKSDSKIETNDIPLRLREFILCNSNCAKYIRGDSIRSDKDTFHSVLNLDAYAHITSPIRRIVDLLNLIAIQKVLDIGLLSHDAFAFYINWIAQIDFINASMQSTRKIQHDCTLLHLCINEPDLLNKTYNGFLFDKQEVTDGLFRYMVYLPTISMTSYVFTRVELNNYCEKDLKLFVFHDESRFKKKIRLHLVI